MLFSAEAIGCRQSHGSAYSFEVDLDDEEESNEDIIDEEVKPNPQYNQEELVVTICDYDRNNNYYCYDLP